MPNVLSAGSGTVSTASSAAPSCPSGSRPPERASVRPAKDTCGIGAPLRSPIIRLLRFSNCAPAAARPASAWVWATSGSIAVSASPTAAGSLVEAAVRARHWSSRSCSSGVRPPETCSSAQAASSASATDTSLMDSVGSAARPEVCVKVIVEPTKAANVGKLAVTTVLPAPLTVTVLLVRPLASVTVVGLARVPPEVDHTTVSPATGTPLPISSTSIGADGTPGVRVCASPPAVVMPVTTSVPVTFALNCVTTPPGAVAWISTGPGVSPRVTMVLACPDGSVSTTLGDTVALPDTTVKVIGTPDRSGAGSTSCTTRGIGSTSPGSPVCPSPLADPMLPGGRPCALAVTLTPLANADARITTAPGEVP